MPVHYRWLGSPDKQGVPVLDYADYLIDFLRDRKCVSVIQASDLFLVAGKNATLVIHEATLEDELEEEAVDKRHRLVQRAVKSSTPILWRRKKEKPHFILSLMIAPFTLHRY